jgi:predicted nucleotidyltransferase
MEFQNPLQTRRDEIMRLAAIHGVKNVRVFGSFARGEAGPKSDLDLLVDMERGKTFLDLVGFWQDMEDSFGGKVDVVTDGDISPYLKEKIFREAKPL